MIMAVETYGTIYPLQRGYMFVYTMETKGHFQFEIIINVLVSFLVSIWISVLWVYGHYHFFKFLLDWR